MTLLIPPKEDVLIQSFLASQDIHKFMEDKKGPIQILFPQNMKKNVDDIQAFFEEKSIPFKTYFAHKANKNKAFVQEAKRIGICMDVASEQELQNALDAGFSGEDIECTGIKTKGFIALALEHHCSIVIDALYEISMVEQLKGERKPRVQFRIADPVDADRCITRATRFGILKEEFLHEIQNISPHEWEVEGLHLHMDEYNPEIKSQIIMFLVGLMQNLFSAGHTPTKVNIGGGYRAPLIDPKHQEAIVNAIEHVDLATDAYARTFLGLEVSRNGNLSRSKILDRLLPKTAQEFFRALFSQWYSAEENILATIQDLGLTIAIEPGYALLQQCGIVIMSVLGTKNTIAGEVVILNGNMYNISSHLRGWLTDPLLIKKKAPEEQENWSGFVMGNLCKEDDILLDRKVHFSQKPEAGDVLVFINTAGYYGGFEDAQPILQPRLKDMVAYKKEEHWVLQETEA